MVDIFVPKKVRLEIIRKETLASPGDVELKCGRCGGRVFKAYVTPRSNGAGKVRDIVCMTKNCAEIFKLDDQGQIGGQVEVNNGNHKKRI